MRMALIRTLSQLGILWQRCAGIGDVLGPYHFTVRQSLGTLARFWQSGEIVVKASAQSKAAEPVKTCEALYPVWRLYPPFYPLVEKFRRT